MLDIVKFTWRNTHGYWIPVAWTLAKSDQEDVRSLASIGRPGMTDLKVTDRVAIPEELRLTGRSRRLLSEIILYDKKADDYSAQEMLEAMLSWTA